MLGGSDNVLVFGPFKLAKLFVRFSNLKKPIYFYSICLDEPDTYTVTRYIYLRTVLSLTEYKINKVIFEKIYS